MDADAASAWLDWWKRIDTILDLEGDAETIVPHEVVELAQERQKARSEKNWKCSDELREQIFALGWELRDTTEGPKVTRRSGSG